MSCKKTINKNKLSELELEFRRSAEEFEKVTPEQTKLDKVRALYINEFNYWGQERISWELWRLDLSSLLGLSKQETAVQIRNMLQSRLPQKSWHILKAWEYVSWLLDDTYTWFD